YEKLPVQIDTDICLHILSFLGTCVPIYLAGGIVYPFDQERNAFMGSLHRLFGLQPPKTINNVPSEGLTLKDSRHQAREDPKKVRPYWNYYRYRTKIS
ncbi:MAG: hypothetical protein ABII21_04650, partial [bacterium]